MSRGGRRCKCHCQLGAGCPLRAAPLLQVGFQCEIPRELFLRLFPTAAFEVPQTELEINKEAFVQVLPLSWCPARASQPSLGQCP